MSNKDNEFQDIQEAIFDYFEDTDNKTLAALIDVFVFKKGTQDTNISKLCEKFMKDNDLIKATMNVHWDDTHPDQPFLRSSLTERSILQQVNVALLTLAYNRFRRIV